MPSARPAMIEVRVNRKAADRVASGHPWIFASDVTDIGGAQPGEAVKVGDPKGRPLGTAHFSSSSEIAVLGPAITSKLQSLGTALVPSRERGSAWM